MKKQLRSLVSIIIALTMLVPTVLPVSAADSSYGFVDFPTGWSAPAMSHAVENGLIYGKSSDRIAPLDNLTRAEMATIINRAFGATVTKDISEFSDVSESQWYYNDIKKAYNMQTLYGDAGKTMRPDAFIIREEAIAIVARAMVLSGYSASNLDKFKDKAEIADWAVDPLASMAANGYVNGDENSNMNPKAFITREEFAQLLHNIVKHYYDAEDGVTTFDGNVMVNEPTTLLSDLVVNGDLILGDGVGTSTIVLKNVKVTGRILIRGANHISFENSSFGGGVTVKNVNDVVHFDHFSDEVHFNDMKDHTEVTFKKKTTGGGGGGGTPPPPATTANYKVEHYQEALDGNYYIVSADTEILTANVGNTVTATPKTYEGFNENTSHPSRIPSATVLADGSLVLKLYYARNSYTVTFDFGAGATVDAGTQTSKTDKYGATVVLPTTGFSNGALNFGGWFTGDNGAGDQITQVVIGTSNTTVYAYWTAQNIYKVEHYQENIDGSYSIVSADTQTLTADAGTLVTAVPKVYTGFYENTSHAQRVPSGTVLADNSLVLKLYYQRNTYTFTFDEQGGIISGTPKTVYKFGETLELPIPVKGTDTFGGWWTLPNGTGTKIENTSILGTDITSAAITVYAYWISGTTPTAGYTVEHYQEAIDGTYSVFETENLTGTIGATVTAVAKTYTGFSENATYPSRVPSGAVVAGGTLTLKLYYLRNSYDIVYDYGEAGGSNTVSFKYGESVDLSAPVVTPPAGKYFAGWYDASTGGTQVIHLETPVGGTTLYAQWAPALVDFTVEHYKQELDGTYSSIPAQESTEQEYTETVVNASDYDVTFDGFTFDALNSPSVTILGDGSSVLKIYYIRETYTVSFDTGLGTAVSPVVYKYGQAFTEPATTRPGYEVEGWYKTSTFDAATKVSAGDLAGTAFTAGTLYANWTPDIVDFKVEHYKQELDGTYSSIPAQESTEQEYTETVVNASDYKTIFAGFTFDASSPSVTILPDGSAVLKIYYTRNAHNVTYNYENGTTAPLVVPNVKYNAQVNLAEPERSLWPAGKYFTGWSLTQNGATVVLYPMPDEDLNLYAVWGNNPPYQLQYLFENADDDDYTINPAYSTTKNDVVEGQSALIPELSTIPTGFVAYPGYSEEVLSGTVVADPQLVLKRFYKRVRFTVDLNYQGADGNNTVLSQEYKYEQTENLPTPTKTGYIFAGWFTALDNTGVLIADGQKLTAGGTLYAKWTPDMVDFKVEHYKQEIDGTYSSIPALSSTEQEYTETIVKPEQYQTTIDGFAFDTTRNSEIAVAGNGTTVLKVYYKRNSYTVNFDFGGATTTLPSSVSYKFEEVVTLPTAGFTNGLKTFAGWYDAAVGGNKVTQITVPLGGTTVYARWADTFFTVKHLIEPLSGTTYTQYGADVTVVAEAGSKVKPEDYDILIDGFAFDTTRNAEITVDEDNTTILEVYYIRNTYAVTYNFNNGTTPDTHTENYKYGQNINLAYVPTVTVPNKHFAGWYDAPVGGQQIDYLTVPVGGTVIYAHWSNNPGYAIEYWHENADDDGYTIVSRQVKNDVEEGQTATIPVRDFAYFTEIAHPQTTLSGTVSSTEVLVLKRYYQRIRFSVDFEYNGATGGNTTLSQDYKYEQTENLPTPTKTGYEFAGWFTAPDDTGVLVADGSKMPFVDKLYAKWTPALVKFIVEHYKQKVETDDFDTPIVDSTQKAYTESIVSDKMASYAGFSVDLSVAGTVNSAIVLPDGTTVLKYYYTRNKYNVIYDYNNDEHPGTLVKTLKFEENVDLSIQPTFTVTNKFFAGWYNAATGGTQITSLTVPVGGTTLYAKWEDNPGYAFEYWQENIYDSGYTRVERTVHNDKTVGTYVGPIPTKTYDGFVENEAKAVPYGNVLQDGSLALKRFYDRKRYTVTFDYRGATAGIASKEYKYGQTADFPTPSREFYDFKGWFTQVNGGGTKIEITDLAGVNFESGTLYAFWEFNWDGEVKFTATVTEEDLDNDMFSIVVDVSNNPVGIAKYDLSLSFDNTNVVAVVENGKVVTDLKATAEGFGADVASITSNADGITTNDEAALLNTITVSWENDKNKSGNANLFKIRFKIIGTKQDEDHEAPTLMRFRMMRAISLIPGLESLPFTLEATTVAVKSDETDDDSYIPLEKVTEGDSLSPYMVEHYKENADNDDYTKVFTQYGHAVLGSVVEADRRNEYVNDGFAYDEENSTNKAKVTESGAVLKLYYLRPRFTVTFDYQNATTEGIGSVSLKAGAKVYNNLPSESTFGKTDYNFSGWYTEPNGQGTKVDENYASPFEDVTLYAYWTQTLYKVEHYKQNIDGTYPSAAADTEEKQAKAGTSVTATAKSYLGYDAPATMPSAVVAEDGSTVIKVYYTRKTYTIDYQFGNGYEDGSAVRTFKYGQSIELAKGKNDNGLVLGGWYTETDGNGTKITNTANIDDILSSLAGDTITLYANWVEEMATYYVEFYKQSIDVSNYYPQDLEATITREGAIGSTVSVDANDPVIKDKYVGFTLNTQVSQLSKKHEAEGTRLLVYYDRNSYTLTLNFGVGATVDGSINKTPSVKYEASYTLPVPEDGFSNGNLIFAGWYDAPTGGNKVTKVTMGAADTEVYARWAEDIGVYSIEFYKQNLENDEYTLVTADTQKNIEDAVGETVSVDTTSDAIKNKYPGFAINTSLGKLSATLTKTGTLLKVYYSRNHYDVTYDYGEAGGSSTATLKYGATIDLAAPSVTVAGKYFAGWFTAPTGGEKVTSLTVPVDGITLYAQWSADPSYTVKHYKEALDGTYPESDAEVEYIQAELNANVTAVAKTFTGFSEDASNPSRVVSGTNDGNLTLKLYYTRNTYTVTFDYKGGSVTGEPKTEYKYEETIQLPAATKTGYEFAGWYTAPAGGIQVTESYKVTQGVTIYAKWEPALVNVTVKHMLEKLDGTYAEEQTESTTEYTESKVKPENYATTFNGFTFDATRNAEVEVLADGSTVVEVYYNRKVYTINYQFGTGIADGTYETSFKYGESVTLAKGTNSDGTVLGGWYTAEDGGGTRVGAAGASVNIAELVTLSGDSITLYANWVESYAEYSIEFYQQNVEDDEYTIVAVDTQTGLTGTIGRTVSVDIASSAIADKYTGFKVNESDSELSKTLNSEGTVLKVYYDRKIYTLNYDYSDADKTGIASDTFKYGQTITFPLESTFKKTGYKFAGWYKTTNFAADELLDLSFVIEDVVDVSGGETQTTIYVKWSEVFTVTFREGAKIGTYTVDPEVSNTVPYSAFPYDKLKERYKTGYFEDASVSSVYAGNEYTHQFEGDWYYTDDNGDNVLFTDETIVDRDLTVRYKFRYIRLELFAEELGHNVVLEVPFEESTRLIDTIKDEMFVNQEFILLAASELDARQKFIAANLKLVDFLADKGLKIDPGQIFAEDGEILKQHVKFNAFAYLDEASTKAFVVKAIRTTFINDPLRMRGVIDEMMKEQDKDVVDLMDTMLVSMLTGVDGERIKGIIADAVESAIENDETGEFKAQLKTIITSRLDTEAHPDYTGAKVVTESVKQAVNDYFMNPLNDENIREIVSDLIDDAFETNDDTDPVRAFVKSYITNYLNTTDGSTELDKLIKEMGEELDKDDPADQPVIDLIHDVLDENVTYLETLVDNAIEKLGEYEETDELYIFIVDAIVTELTNDTDELVTLINEIANVKPTDLSSALKTIMKDDQVFGSIVTSAMADDEIFKKVVKTVLDDAEIFEIIVRDLSSDDDFYSLLVDVAFANSTLTDEVKNAVVNNDDTLVDVLKEISLNDYLKEQIAKEIASARDSEIGEILNNSISSTSPLYQEAHTVITVYEWEKAEPIIKAGITEAEYPDYWADARDGISMTVSMEVDDYIIANKGAIPGDANWDALWQEGYEELMAPHLAKLEAGEITESDPYFQDIMMHIVSSAASEVLTAWETAGIPENSEYRPVVYDMVKWTIESEIYNNMQTEIENIRTDVDAKNQVADWIINPGDSEALIASILEDFVKDLEPDDGTTVGINRDDVVDEVISTVNGMSDDDKATLVNQINAELVKPANASVKATVTAKAIEVLSDDENGTLKNKALDNVIEDICAKPDLKNDLVGRVIAKVSDPNETVFKNEVIAEGITALKNDPVVNLRAIAIINDLIEAPPAEPDGINQFKENIIEHMVDYILGNSGVRAEAMGKVVDMIEDPNDTTHKQEAIEFAFNVLGANPTKRIEIVQKFLTSTLGDATKRQNMSTDAIDIMFSDATLREIVLDEGFEQLFLNPESVVSLALDELISDDALRREMIIAVISTENGRRSILDILFDELERDSTFIDDMVDIAMKGKYGDMVDKFVHDLINSGVIEINPDNRQIAEEIVLPMLDDITLDKVLEKLPAKITDILPIGRIEQIFNKFKGKARELLVEGIEEAKDGNSKAITVMIDNDIDIINELLVPVYNKVFPKVVDKAEDFYYYNENIYLKAIVDMLDPTVLLDNSKPASSGGTGYRLRTTTEYYEILRNAITLADDAAGWYMENISDDQIDNAINKISGKVKTYLDKLNGFVGGRIPVSKVNTIANYAKKILDKRENVYNATTLGMFARSDEAYDKLISFVKEKTGVDITKSTTIEVTFDGSRLSVNDKDINIDNYDISISVKGYTFKLDSHSITVQGKTVDISRFVQKAADLFGTRTVTVKVTEDAPYAYSAYVGNNYVKLSAEYK